MPEPSAPRPELPELRAHQRGTTLPVRLQPKGSANRIVGVAEGRLRVQVTAPPVDGRANQALTELLAKLLGLARREVELLHGETSREKTVLLVGLTPEDAAAKLAEVLR